MNHSWRTSQNDCTNDDENNLPKLQEINQANQQQQQQHSLQLSLRNERTEVCIGTEMIEDKYPRVGPCIRTIHGFTDEGESSSSSHQTHIAVFNDFNHISVNFHNNFFSHPKRRFNNFARNKGSELKIIRKKKITNSSGMLALRNSIIRDHCNIKLNRLKITDLINDNESRDLIMKMSSLSCNNNMLHYRECPQILLTEETRSRRSEDTSRQIVSIEDKFRDANGEVIEDRPYQSWSFNINGNVEIEEIDELRNLSIRDELDIIM